MFVVLSVVKKKIVDTRWKSSQFTIEPIFNLQLNQKYKKTSSICDAKFAQQIEDVFLYFLTPLFIYFRFYISFELNWDWV